jgi:hypothetical protein
MAMTATTDQVLNRVRISGVYQALGGPKPRGMRGPAFWRRGDGLNVSMDDSRGVWKDFASNEGGGILDLVARVRGGGRADALRWVADLAGVPLDNTPISAEDRARWAVERRDTERSLPTARYWQRAAVCMAEELLNSLKAALFDPTLPQPDVGEIASVENLLGSLRRVDGAALVAEYKWRLERRPGMTAALVHVAKQREQAARRALLEYLKRADPATREAVA